MRIAAWIVLLGGCDFTWNLDRIDGSDAGFDAGVDARFDTGECPSDYQLALFSGSLYRITPDTFAAWDVSDDCNNDKQGITHLAVAQTRDELDTLIENLATTGIGDWRLGAVQVAGGSAPADRWIWVTGEGIAPTLWDAPVEPNDGEGTEDSIEQFGHIRGDRPGLIDYEGSAGMRGLCECDGRPLSAEANTAIELLRP